MAQRPTFIDLESRPSPFRSRTSSPSGRQSPRVTHVAGDIPPAMSPLDAFAAQSRLLAKQLDDSRRNGRRVSRLPPLAVAHSLAKPRPGYFRSGSTDTEGSVTSDGSKHTQEETAGNKAEVEVPTFRPKSHYPTMSTASQASNVPIPIRSPLTNDQRFSTPGEHPPLACGDYFGVLRAQSPESAEPSRNSLEDVPSISESQGSFDSVHRKNELERGPSLESTSSRSQYAHSLLPPAPHYARHTPSIRSVTIDSSDDENQGYTPESSVYLDRQFSASSNISLPQSPLSPFTAPHARPPSVGSEYSMSGNRLSRPTFNFSRPLSRTSRPSNESYSHSRQHSSELLPQIITEAPQATGEAPIRTPSSAENEEFFDSREQQPEAVPSYIYSKYSLPRGRMLERDSIPLANMMEWEKAPNGRIVQTVVSPSPTQDTSLPTPPHSIESERPSAPASPEQVSPVRRSLDPEDTANPRPPPIPISNHQHRHSMTSMNSGSTIKASQRTVAASMELTAEDHLAKGIECHERGSLKESTYHLRIAARQNHPTAMLLYALACRHGWGMRQNPQEGVQWLRKAMDCAGIELQTNEEPEQGRKIDATERKTRKAQFALSVYELGVSHMNGWGIEQDKALALRCFEIASSWGDADAMAEAGFCYAQGVGCKKDLKKAAKYYRAAESKGMSMVGNSWIYKPKYADEKSSDDRSARSTTKSSVSEKKPRDKSRTRSIWGRKKSVA